MYRIRSSARRVELRGGAHFIQSQLHTSRHADAATAAATMASKSVSHHDWDYEKLQEELRKQTELRDGLLKTTEHLQQAVQDSEKMLQNFSTEDMNSWKEHYLQQLSHNQQLEAQLKQLDRKVTELRNQLKEGLHHRGNDTEQGYEGMSDVTMRQLLRKLEKEKAEIEWQLKECEWRLDQEAAAVHRAEEEKKTILTELGHASLELEKSKQKHTHQQTDGEETSHQSQSNITKSSK